MHTISSLLLGMSIAASAAVAADHSFSCRNADDTVTADLTGPDSAHKLAVAWPTFDGSFSNDQLFLFPGEVLWPDLPNSELNAWPYGSYVGKDKSKDLTVIVNIVHPTSTGGGGYFYEGTMSISAKDNDPVVVPVYCR